MARVLVVDDEISMRETLKQMLEFNGHKADTASDGAQAVGLIKKTDYDLVLLDRNMPVMSGIDVLRAIRSAPQYQDLKVIMLTSADVNKEIEEAFAAGASGYVLKTSDPKQIITKIKSALETK